jgi:hypothetical protein
MGRSELRELIRRAQAAEIAGELEQAVDLLAEAARSHLDEDNAPRAAVLLRHALRLRPDRQDLRHELDRAELPDSLGPPGRSLEVAQRGPTVADPSLDCWCSFCCRPRSEAGPMVAGPAGAFICARCVGAAAGLAGDDVPARAPLAPASSSPPASDFIEAAVVLSKALGWSLADIRSLSPAEIERALKKLERLGR